MSLGLRLAPKALTDHSCHYADTCFASQNQMAPEDGMSTPRLLAVVLREAVSFSTVLCRKMKLNDKG